MSDTTRIARLHLQCNYTYSSSQLNISQYGFTSQFKKFRLYPSILDSLSHFTLCPLATIKMCHPRCGAESVGARLHLPCTGNCPHHSRRCSPGLRRTDTENNCIIRKLLADCCPWLHIPGLKCISFLLDSGTARRRDNFCLKNVFFE